MQILTAKHSGFCWGVRRAMDTAVWASARFRATQRIQTLGPLIHNHQALEHLNRRHIERVDGLQDLREGVVIIRAHGIRQEEHAALREGRREGRLILANATCPEVGRVHAFIRTWRGRGYFTLILGQADHSEVIGHLSYAGPQGAVIRSIAEVDTLPDAVLGKVLVVAQTTFLTSDFWTLVNRIKERAGHTVVKNTICRETWLRQNEARDLVRKVDTVVVVGGKSSNNTRHLVGVAESLCPCGRRA